MRNAGSSDLLALKSAPSGARCTAARPAPHVEGGPAWGVLAISRADEAPVSGFQTQARGAQK
eukprot:9469147-Pyramimonas_sp.AAC.1